MIASVNSIIHISSISLGIIIIIIIINNSFKRIIHKHAAVVYMSYFLRCLCLSSYKTESFPEKKKKKRKKKEDVKRKKETEKQKEEEN